MAAETAGADVEDVTASLEAVAKDAGVGHATLLRHFPTRDALLASLLRMHRERLLERQHELDRLTDAGETLRSVVSRRGGVLRLVRGPLGTPDGRRPQRRGGSSVGQVMRGAHLDNRQIPETGATTSRPASV
ncbi:TetR/AcrR family transcriptional regulator [Nonomuraea fuscirosea]|uniref:TetR/AcrR family transcriptional regulator n=1 Tax=Nonomuraea fuscirosea TaxID=1291556 RepID=UPI003435FC3E